MLLKNSTHATEAVAIAVDPKKQMIQKKWKTCKPTESMRALLDTQKVALAMFPYMTAKRLSKYDAEFGLRILFSGNRICFYPHGNSHGGMKKLGDFPEMTLEMAKAAGKAVKEGANSGITVHAALASYQKDLARRVKLGTMTEGSYATYKCRVKKLGVYFNRNSQFAELSAGDLQQILDQIIENESSNYARELYAEMKRVWTFCCPLYAMGRNVLGMLQENYVSSRVGEPTATRVFPVSEAVAELYINTGMMNSLQQRNAVRFLILSGVRPVNVMNLKWAWVDNPESPTEITYPASAMKQKRKFTLPLTPGLAQLLKAQWEFRANAVMAINQEFVFLKPTELTKPFPKRSLDKLIKQYYPLKSMIFVEEPNVKGRNGAFCTLFRKFAKSNMCGLLEKAGKSAADARLFSAVALGHSVGKEFDYNNLDDNYLYDGIHNTLRQGHLLALTLHENSIMDNVERQKEQPRWNIPLHANREALAKENAARQQIRQKIKNRYGKTRYADFLLRRVDEKGNRVKEAILSAEGRKQVNTLLMALASEQD